MLAGVSVAFAILSFFLRGFFERAFDRAEALKEANANRDKNVNEGTDKEMSTEPTAEVVNDVQVESA
jgi:hypothetical protein